MSTASKAAPRLPENNDGSSYLYISLNDPTPESIHLAAPRAPMRVPPRLEETHYIRSVSLLSPRRVKSLTHIPPELQARLGSRKNRHESTASCFLRSRWNFLLEIGDRTEGCTADLLRVLCQRAPSRIGLRGHPGFAPALELCGADIQGNFTTLCINGNPVAGLDQGQRTAHCRLRRYVSGDEAVAAAGEPSVGDHRDLLPQSLAHDRGGGT